MQRFKTLMTVSGLLIITMFMTQECQSETATTTSQPPAATPASPTPSAPAAAGSSDGKVTAKVTFTGTPPVMTKLKREADPFCGKTAMHDQSVVVNSNGTLKNVVVRVSQGATAAATPPTESVHIDQQNCMYTPRVVAGVVGQKLLIKNSDPVLHNVHTYVGATTGFNQAQMKGAKDIEKVVASGVIKFKCDVHPWMTGYVIGNDNSFVCVTGDTGDCSFSGVPAGTYTVEAWHEQFGAKTANLTVTAGQPATVDFAYAAQ